MITLTKPLDFSEQTFRGSSGGAIMTNPRGKSSMDRYIEEKEKLDTLVETSNKKIKEATEKLLKATEKTKDKLATALAKVSDDYGAKEKKQRGKVEKLEKFKDFVTLSDTCKKKLIELYIFKWQGRVNEITNKYIEKGLLRESNAIDILTDVIDEYFDKNTERRNNGWVEGECDIDWESNNCIIDTKCSWDVFTWMPKSVNKVDHNYFWQGIIYMILWERLRYIIAYVLVNTPESLVKDEQDRLMYGLGKDVKNPNHQLHSLYIEGCEKIRQKLIYDDIPNSHRVLLIPFEYQEIYKEQLYKRIAECRQWLNEFAKEHFEIISRGGYVNLAKLQNSEDEIDEAEFEEVTEVETEPITIEELVNATNAPIQIDLEDSIIEVKATVQTETMVEPTSMETKELVVETTEELVGFMMQINSCTSKPDVIYLFKQLKPHFEKYANLKTLLEAKRDSFTESTAPSAASIPKAATPIPAASTPIPKPATPIPAAPPKPVAPVVEVAKTDDSLEETIIQEEVDLLEKIVGYTAHFVVTDENRKQVSVESKELLTEKCSDFEKANGVNAINKLANSAANQTEIKQIFLKYMRFIDWIPSLRTYIETTGKRKPKA